MRFVRLIALFLWTAVAFWVFSFSFSSSFFEYSLPSRLPPFLAALAGAVALPISAYWQWARARRGASRLGAWLAHVACGALCLVPLAVTSAVMARLPSPFRLSGDDAMGVGITFLFLALAAVVSAVVLGMLMIVRRRPRVS
jgi:hypothetical protein